MSLHAQIMNIATTRDAEDAEYSNRREAYMSGHRDARHAAAEIALNADAAIEELKAELARLMEKHNNLHMTAHELRKDARRYRMLCEVPGTLDAFTAAYYNTQTKAELDAAVDEVEQ